MNGPVRSVRSVGISNPSPAMECAALPGGCIPPQRVEFELVQVANDLAIIQRDLHDIRKDYGEHLFLLLQIEGECGIEQYGRQTIVAPGDCVLVDSSSPSTFHFGGRFSNHLSVHLPRQIFFSDRSTRVDISRRVEADDPMSSILRGLVAKLMKTDSSDKRAPELRQLLFSATRQAFASDDCDDLTLQSDCAYHRIEIVQILIDRHLTEENSRRSGWPTASAFLCELCKATSAYLAPRSTLLSACAASTTHAINSASSATVPTLRLLKSRTIPGSTTFRTSIVVSRRYFPVRRRPLFGARIRRSKLSRP